MEYTMKTIRIVAADDSRVMREIYTRMFAAAVVEGCRLELSAVVPDGASCLHAVRTLRPDVVLLDLHMPGVDGLETIKRLREEWPKLPIIMCSVATADGAAETLEALARGASDYVTKPVAQKQTVDPTTHLFDQLSVRIMALTMPVLPSLNSREQRRSRQASPIAAIAIGSSTGGPAALERLLTQLPAGFPSPIVVAQHMPKLFTAALAERLGRCCRMQVREATEGSVLRAGTIWIAPGDAHMEVRRDHRGTASLSLRKSHDMSECHPSVDVLFQSFAAAYGGTVAGVVLTGMGSDGLRGSRAIVAAGGVVFAQNRESSAVWGMPGKVASAGLAGAALPPEEIAQELIAMHALEATRKDVSAQKIRYRELMDGTA
jgi:two-component system chemotaxis response regulator CheB